MHADPLLFIIAQCALCRVTVLMSAKNHNLWHKCHYETFTVLTAAVGVLFHHLCCVLCVCGGLQQEPAINSRDRKSMFRLRVPCFCLFSNQPLSANATTPFIDSSTDSQQPTHIQFCNNAQVNIIFL